MGDGLLMKPIEQQQTNNLDKEWIALMIAARNLGFTLEEVREFIRKGDFSEFNSPQSIHNQRRES